MVATMVLCLVSLRLQVLEGKTDLVPGAVGGGATSSPG